MFTHSLPLPTLETLACFGPTHIFKKKIYDTLGDVNPHIFRKKIYDTLGDAKIRRMDYELLERYFFSPC
jgi:hypothetical protein